MTNVKKTLSVLLAFVLVLGTCMFSAFAAGTDTATIKVVPDKTTANVGDVITVSVKLDANYAVASTSAIVKFDTADFQLVEAPTVNKTLFGSELATDAVAYNDAEGVVGAYFVAKKGAEYKVQTDVVLFSFKLKALKANANAALTLPTEELKSTAKPDGKIYCGKGDTSDNIVEVPCTIALTNAAVNIGGGAVATPTIKGVGTGFVDEAKGFVYGVPAGTTTETALNALFTAENGTLRWEVGTASTLGGTGTTVTLVGTDGADVKTYTLVVFGDLNGDTIVDSVDAGIIDGSIFKMTTLDPAQEFAGDLNMDTLVDSVDSGIIDGSIFKMTTIEPNIYA